LQSSVGTIDGRFHFSEAVNSFFGGYSPWLLWLLGYAQSGPSFYDPAKAFDRTLGVAWTRRCEGSIGGYFTTQPIQGEPIQGELTRMLSMWKLRELTWRKLLRRTWSQFWEDRILDQSAKLSFYFLLSFFPLLVSLIALLGILLQSGPVLKETLHKYLAAVVPESASDLINTTLQEVTRGSSGGKLSLALLFALWAATQGMAAIIESLNVAYEVEESRPWWKRKLIALGLTIVSFGLIAWALLLMIYGGRLSEILVSTFGFSTFIAGIWKVLQWPLLLGFVLTAFNTLYLYAPNVKHRRWHWLMPGTVVGVALWLMVSFGFKLYLSLFDRFTITYGSIGAVIILLLWLYLSGTAILIGGEVNSEIEKASVEKPRSG
jgi:membrane protein